MRLLSPKRESISLKHGCGIWITGIMIACNAPARKQASLDLKMIALATHSFVISTDGANQHKIIIVGEGLEFLRAMH